MKVTTDTVIKALARAITEQEIRVTSYVEVENWRNAAESDAYLSGLRYAAELVNMLRIEEDE